MSSKLFMFAGLTLLLLVTATGFVLQKAGLAEASLPLVASENNDPASQWDGLVAIAGQQARHFKGSPDAPVTILEFSDFQ